MATTNGPGLVELLLQDHGEAKRMLLGLEELPAEDRAVRFRQVVRALVAHEVAEETVVFPALRECAAGGGAIAHDRLEEQKAAERLLADLERTPVDDPTFESTFRKLRTAVLEHADAEERTAFWVLSSNLTPSELAELGARYEQVKRRAPTHAHPLAPDTPPANKVAGPMAGMFDRVRDVLGLRDAPRLRAAIHGHDVSALLRSPRSSTHG